MIGEPYAVLDWESFIKRVVEESNMVRGIADLPYTRQYIDTPAYLYQIWNTSVWGTGIPLGIVAFGGLLWATVRGLIRRRSEDLLLLSWVLVYFLINGSFMVKFLRYMLPILPFLCILGAAAVVALKDWLAARGIALGAGRLAGRRGCWWCCPRSSTPLAFVNVYAETAPLDPGLRVDVPEPAGRQRHRHRALGRPPAAGHDAGRTGIAMPSPSVTRTWPTMRKTTPSS